VDGIHDPQIKLVFTMIARMMEDMERRILQKVHSESAHFESAFAQLQDILIDWNDQTLEAHKLQKSADTRIQTKIDQDMEIVQRMHASSAENHKASSVGGDVTYAPGEDADFGLYEFMRNNIATVRHNFPRTQAATSSNEGPVQQEKDIGPKWIPRVTTEADNASDTSRGRLQQQQKTLSLQLQAHQASVAQTTSQLPMWLRLQGSKSQS